MMSIDINIGENNKTGIHGGLVGSSHKIAPLVYHVARILEALFPIISEKSCFIDGYEFIDISELDSDEFMVVYKLTKIEFDRYCNINNDLENVKTLKNIGDYVAKNWLIYMWFLEHDERFTGEEIREFDLYTSELG